MLVFPQRQDGGNRLADAAGHHVAADPANGLAPDARLDMDGCAAASYGFMERPDIPALLRQAHEGGCAIDLSDVTYYVGHETVVPGDDEKALPQMVEALFAFMQRNSAHLTEYSGSPSTRSSKSDGKSRSEPGSRNLNMQFAGNVVPVTGAQQGIGRAMALEFAASGADVAINWLDDDGAAQRVAEEVRAYGAARFWLTQTWVRSNKVLFGLEPGTPLL
jgi:hypothetical protein